MPTATVTSKGQITIPAAVRHTLGLHAGDRVDFVELADGNFALRPATRSVARLRGFFGPWTGDGALTIEQMNEAVADAVAETNL